MTYADSSALVSLHLRDAHTAAALSSIRTLGQPLCFTALHRLEFRNAISLSVFRGHQTQEMADLVMFNLADDLRARLLVPTPIRWFAAFRRATVIAATQSPTLGTRSLDILHVACAEQLGATDFLTFDGRQHKLAVRLGFSVHP